MSIFTYRKDKLRLQNEINTIKDELIRSFTTKNRVFWDSQGNMIPLFDFNDNNDIYKAVKSVPELASVLNYIGKSFSSGKHFESIGDELKEGTPILQILNKPNEFYSGSEFKQTFAESLFAFGRVHIYINTPSIPLSAKSMYILPTHKVKTYIGKDSLKDILDESDSILHYELDLDNGKKLEIPVSKVITVTLNTNIDVKDKYIHYESPLKPLQDVLKVPPAMYDTMRNLMENDGMKGFVSNASTDSGSWINVESEDKEEIQRSFKGYGNRKGQNQLAFVKYDLKYVPISSRIKDLMLPEQQKMIKTVIADILGFDTAILNNDAANKYANYKEARKSLFTENIIPAAANYTESLTNYFKKNIVLDFSHLDVFSEDEGERAETTAKKSQYIRDLNMSVSKKEMSRESAIYFLNLEGYTKEESEQLISMPYEKETEPETIEETEE